MASGLALRFLSGRYEGGEFALPDRGDVVIGRSAEGDVVLVEDMVSRRHARIHIDHGVPTLEDLGSTNGTYVNGEKVGRTRLGEGDRILIGTSILKVVSATVEDSTHEMLETESRPDLEDDEPIRQEGQLGELSVADLAQLFGSNQRSGELRLRAGEAQGCLYFRKGWLYYASIDDDHDMGPMKALARLLAWDRGDYVFKTGLEDHGFMLELEDTTENLISQALAEMQELKELAPLLPASDSELEIPRPLPGQLSDLSLRHLEVFQLVYDHGLMVEVMNRATSNDAETARTVLKLLDLGFVSRPSVGARVV
ncbi:MAG: FHA domain-containing protein [Myxococcota bacterium]